MCLPCMPCLGCMPMLCSAGARANKTDPGATDVGSAFSTEFKLMTKRKKTHQYVYAKTPEELAADAEAAEAAKKARRRSFGLSSKPAAPSAEATPAAPSPASPSPASPASTPRAGPLAGQLSKRRKKESKDMRETKARLEALVGGKPTTPAKPSRFGGRLT